MATATSDGDSSIAKVDFYVNSSLVASSYTAPYVVNAQNLSAGSYNVTAVATDQAGAATTSDSVALVVADPPGGDACAGGHLSPTNATISSAGGRISFVVIAPTGCEWTISSSASWASPLVSFGAGTVTIPVAVDQNTTGTDRVGTITATASNANGSATFTLTQLGGPAPPPPPTDGDNDHDGILDSLEYDLAVANFPAIHYSNSEGCDGPRPRLVLFRARHPRFGGVPYTDYIAITYVLLYDRDCGRFEFHDGDDESLMVFLKWNGSAWTYQSTSATAHWGAGSFNCEKWTASYGRDIWVGNNKHGMYAQFGECTGCGILPGPPWEDDNCSWEGYSIQPVF